MGTIYLIYTYLNDFVMLLAYKAQTLKKTKHDRGRSTVTAESNEEKKNVG